MGRILWSAQFHVGCTYTALPIVLRLRDRGHQVVVLSVPEAEPKFRSFGFGFSANNQFPIYDFGQAGAVPGREDGYQKWWRSLVRLQMADTTELLDREHFDLVFGGGCMQLCGHGFAAELAGIPWVSYIDFLVDEADGRDAAFPMLWDKWRASMGLQSESRPPAESLWFPFSPWLVLYLVHAQLSFGAAPNYVRRVGASMWEAPFTGSVPSWLGDLGVRREAVLVSTSSLWQDDVGLVGAVAEAFRDKEVDVVATVAADHELPAVAENVILAGRFPHALLMPRVHCVVCSAGLGTVTRALCAGVPVVVVPRSGDGFNVARLVERLGVGVVLAPAEVGAGAIRGAIQRARSDPSIREAVGGFVGDMVTPQALETAADEVEALMTRELSLEARR